MQKWDVVFLVYVLAGALSFAKEFKIAACQTALWVKIFTYIPGRVNEVVE